MPIVARCLALRLSFMPGKQVCSGLVFRANPDRHGESGDVVSWRQREDPRTRMLLLGLLHGLADNLRHYTTEGAEGYELALVRVDVHPAVLPLKVALGRAVRSSSMNRASCPMTACSSELGVGAFSSFRL